VDPTTPWDMVSSDNASQGVWTYLGFIRTESSMTECQPLQPDRELDITAPHDILNLEFGKLGVES